MTPVTTATLWVCSRCAFVSHVDGGAERGIHDLCPVPVGKLHIGAGVDAGDEYQRHALKPVLVVVPYA